MENKNSASPAFLRGRTLVVGDTIVDIYRHGTPLGVSVETPTMVVKHESTKISIGGAGFLVRNLLALGGTVTFVTLTGADDYARYERSLAHARLKKQVIRDPGRLTTVKERFWSGNHKLLAWDRVDNSPLSASLEKSVLSFVRANIKTADKLVVSDYRHGLISEHLARELVRIAKAAKKPVYVDSQVSKHAANHRWYEGADLFCINVKEAHDIDRSFDDTALKKSLSRLRKTLGAADIVLKLGEKGSAAWIGDRWLETPGVKVPARDTTGAGDAFFAVLALSKEVGPKELGAANAWAALKTTRIGTETPSLAEFAALLKTV